MNKRRTPYRKNVEKDVLEALPEPNDNQRIMQCVQSHGSNIFEVAFPPEPTNLTDPPTPTPPTTTLARLPAKFRKLIWVKRGTYLLCSSSDTDYQTASGEKGRVTMNVDYVLFELQVKHLKKRNLWPAGWSTAFDGTTEYSREEMLKVNSMEEMSETKDHTESKQSKGGTVEQEYLEEEEDNDDDLFVNRNRMQNNNDSDTDLSSDDD